MHAVQPCALRVCETVGSTPVAVPKPKAAQAFSPEPMTLHVRADWRGSSCRVISHAHTRWYPIQKQPPFSLGEGTASGGRKYPQDLPASPKTARDATFIHRKYAAHEGSGLDIMVKDDAATPARIVQKRSKIRVGSALLLGRRRPSGGPRHRRLQACSGP